MKTIIDGVEIELTKEQINKIKTEKRKLPITDRIKNYKDVLEICGTSESDDEVKIKGFDESENNLVKNIIKKIRITKVYREGELPKRGQRRYYPWFDVSSGFVFVDAYYDVSYADSSSASRLCLLSDEHTQDYAKKFKDVEEAIIEIKD